MKIKYSDLIGDWLQELGYTHCFLLPGGGCMHLVDSFRSRFQCIPVVHEITAGIAVEHFNESRVNGRAFALVTTGPGLTNIVTAIAGAYVERRELLVIAGQVKSSDLLSKGLRQRGVQEVDGTELVKPITVASKCIQRPISKKEFFDLASISWGPHPGPVTIEVCLDVQGAEIDVAHRFDLESEENFSSKAPLLPSGSQEIDLVVEKIRGSLRPLFLLGGLVSRDLCWKYTEFFERLGIPVATTTSAIDRMHSGSKVFAGRPGTWGGQRSANLIIAQADLVLAIGAQLDLQQTGFNHEAFMPLADIIQVYPCVFELNKGHPPINLGINTSPDVFFKQLVKKIYWNDSTDWLSYVRMISRELPTIEYGNNARHGFIQSFQLLRSLSLASKPDDIIAICSSGGVFTASLQVFELRFGQKALVSPALASMGYGLATAIGAAFANPESRIISVEGDGGFSQNLQDLATVRINDLNIKMFLFDNNGYGSIRATQRKFFNGSYVGCDSDTGLGMPNWEDLFRAYGIPVHRVSPEEANPESLAKILEIDGPIGCVVKVDPEQNNWPSVSSKVLTDGRIVSRPLYDMAPELPAELKAKVGVFLPQ